MLLCLNVCKSYYDKNKKFGRKVLFASYLVNALTSSAQAESDELSFFIPGVSYHIGANDSNPAYSEAPLGLDKNGAFVYNPGLGVTTNYIGFDLGTKQALCFKPLAMWFQDCAFEPVFLFGAGPGYRFYPLERLSIDVDLFLSMYYAQVWGISYTSTFVPFLSLGLNWHLEKINLGFRTTFSPRSGESSSIGGFHILFTYMCIGLKF